MFHRKWVGEMIFTAQFLCIQPEVAHENGKTAGSHHQMIVRVASPCARSLTTHTIMMIHTEPDDEQQLPPTVASATTLASARGETQTEAELTCNTAAASIVSRQKQFSAKG